jgi:hypothetical protein
LFEKRLADLLPREVYAWRFGVPEGHRFEATQALRQVLNRAVCWGLLDYNPAKLGVPNPARRAKEKRPFETWWQVEAAAAQLGAGVRADGDLRGRNPTRPSELFGLEQRGVDCKLRVVYVRLRERPDQAHEDQAEHTCRSAAGEGAGSTRPAAGIGQPDPVSECAWRQDRFPYLRTQALAASPGQGRD